MTDRLAYGYQPNFDIDAAVGRQGELFVRDIQEGLVAGTVEVKNDQRAAKGTPSKPATGRVYLETRCRYGSEYRESGVAASQAEFWAQIIGDEILVVARTAVFRGAAEAAWEAGYRNSCTRGSHPTMGATVPLSVLLPYLVEATR